MKVFKDRPVAETAMNAIKEGYANGDPEAIWDHPVIVSEIEERAAKQLGKDVEKINADAKLQRELKLQGAAGERAAKLFLLPDGTIGTTKDIEDFANDPEAYQPTRAH